MGEMLRVVGMNDPVVILIDNGSTRAAATLALRDIAARLSRQCGQPVHAASLQHADRIPARQLGGEPARLLREVLSDELRRDRRWFVVVPLLFGDSRALTAFIPEQVAALQGLFGDFQVDVAAPLVPLPQGEPRIVQILHDHVEESRAELGSDPDRIIVVDHGSPLPQVTAVREYAADELARRLPPRDQVMQAVMERREGREYDFNGDLLERLLDRLGSEEVEHRILVAMLFLLPGRHAGPGGDVAEICATAMRRHPRLRIVISPLVGEHPLLIDILDDRLTPTLGKARRRSI